MKAIQSIRNVEVSIIESRIRFMIISWKSQIFIMIVAKFYEIIGYNFANEKILVLRTGTCSHKIETRSTPMDFFQIGRRNAINLIRIVEQKRTTYQMRNIYNEGRGVQLMVKQLYSIDTVISLEIWYSWGMNVSQLLRRGNDYYHLNGNRPTIEKCAWGSRSRRRSEGRKEKWETGGNKWTTGGFLCAQFCARYKVIQIPTLIVHRSRERQKLAEQLDLTVASPFYSLLPLLPHQMRSLADAWHDVYMLQLQHKSIIQPCDTQKHRSGIHE